MKLSLIKVSEKYREQICDMLDEWYASGENIVPYAIRRIDYHDFSFYCENLENRNILSEWGVTDSTFFCLDTERDRVVGAVNIRHYLNESLLLDGGHIGDGVRPSERGKGIATEMIRMALEECRRLGIYRVLMVCNKDNVASARTIQKNGGILENEVEVDGHTEQRYWITLQAEETATVIRHASLEELSDCVEVIRSSFRTVAEEFGITEENAPRFTAFATDEGRLRYHFCVEKRPMYVCLFGGRIVGYYSMSVLNEDETELNNLAVLPEYRNRGIGEALVKDYILKTALIGRKRMKLSLVEENKVLLHWYESFGFTYTESKKYDFFPFTCAYMEKKGTAPGDGSRHEQ